MKYCMLKSFGEPRNQSAGNKILAANHWAVIPLKPLRQMTLTVCGSCARLRITLHGPRFDDKTQYCYIFFFYWNGSVTVNSIGVGV